MLLASLVLVMLVVPIGCDRGDAPPTTTTTATDRPRLASASPAATDILLHLRASLPEDADLAEIVAVSRYDTATSVSDLPRVGDYLTLDFEQLAAADPDTLIVQVSPEKMPPEAVRRAEAMGMNLLHLQIDSLADIEAAVGTLGGAMQYGSHAAVAAFRDELGPAAATADGPRALVVLDSDFSFAAGQGNYLDDLLAHAGLTNAVPSTMASWPTLDDEAMRSLSPEAVVLILPGATDAQLAQARTRFAQVAGEWDVAWDEVIVLRDPYAMVPGWSVTKVAAAMRGAIQ